MKVLLICFFYSGLGFAQMGGVTGSLNQVHKDPALQGFQNSYDDLRGEVKNLDGPKKKSTDSMEKTESSYPTSRERASDPKTPQDLSPLSEKEKAKIRKQ